MEARQITLNLVPGGVMPRIHCSQYDKGVPVEVTIYDGDTTYTVPEDATVYVQGAKLDGTLYQYECTYSGSVVYFDLTIQMTVIAGDNIAELSIYDSNEDIVGTCNFVIDVEESALQDPTESSYNDIPVIADLPGLVKTAEEAAQTALDAVEEIDVDMDEVREAVSKSSTSAQLASGYAIDSENYYLLSKSYAVGDASRVGSSVDNAMFYMNEAKEAAEDAAEDVQTIEELMEDLEEIENRTKGYSDSAALSKTSVDTLYNQTIVAKTSADYFATLSESWAHGQTGIRQDESIDNAMYWANKAQAVAKTTVDSAFSTSSVNPVENQVITNQHVNVNVNQENGVHGLRYWQDELSYYDSDDNTWKEITTGGGSGFKLDPPTDVSFTNLDESCEIKWNDPDDVYVDGHLVAEWNGTIVIRKVGSAPTGRYDGTIVVDSKVRDQYTTNGYVDTGLTNGTTYYYGIFPYTDGGLYTLSSVTTFTPSAIYPSAPTGVSVEGQNGRAKVTFTKPEDATGIRLVYGTTDPSDETDGTYVDGITSPYTVNDLVNGTKYYFKVYAYNAKPRYTGAATVNATPAPVTLDITAINDDFIGATVTATKDGTAYTATVGNDKKATIVVGEVGTWVVTNTVTPASLSVVCSEYKTYEVSLSLASIKITANKDIFIGKTVTVTDGNDTYSQVVPNEKELTFYVGSGTWTISTNLNGDTWSVNVNSYTQFTATIDAAEVTVSLLDGGVASETPYVGDTITFTDGTYTQTATVVAGTNTYKVYLGKGTWTGSIDADFYTSSDNVNLTLSDYTATTASFDCATLTVTVDNTKLLADSTPYFENATISVTQGLVSLTYALLASEYSHAFKVGKGSWVCSTNKVTSPQTVSVSTYTAYSQTVSVALIKVTFGSSDFEGGTVTFTPSSGTATTQEITNSLVNYLWTQSGKTYTITNSVITGSETVDASADNVYNVSISNVTMVSWSAATDAEIAAITKAFYAGDITLAQIQEYWHVGDVREMDISAIATSGTANGFTWSVGESHHAQTVDVVILGFEHDTLTTAINGHTKALVSVEMLNCLYMGSNKPTSSNVDGSSNTENGYMNSSDTNAGGWTNCARRQWCNGGFYDAMPSEIKGAVKQVQKQTTAGSQSATMNTDSDYVFLPSEWEIFGTTTHAKAQEGTQYSYYTTAANRYKYPKWNSSNVSDGWWDRSPSGSESIRFCSVAYNGSAYYNGASGRYGLAPAWAL